MEYSSFTEFVETAKNSVTGKCTACGACLDNCPVFESMQYYKLGSSVIMKSIVNALEKAQPSEEAYNTFYSCMGCGACTPSCPAGIVPSLVMRMAGFEMIKQGWRAPEQLYQINPDAHYNFARVLGGLQVKESSARWYTRAPDNARPADVVLFLGCYPVGLTHKIVTLLDILDHMGIDFVALNGNGLCCGAGRYMVGDIEGTKTAAEELVTNIMAFSPKHVIFECSGCYAWYRFTAPKFMAVPFQSEHTTQYLRNNLDKIKFMRHIDKTVTYHDHCSLGKNAGEFDAPRELLQAIPGIKLVEMEHTMKDSLCCGGPANWSGFGNVTSKYRATRLEEARAVGAELLITTCAGCYTAYVGLDHKYPLSVMGIIELLGEAMGISYQNKYREYVYNDSISTIIEDSWNTIHANGLDPEKMSVMLNMYLADARSLQP